MNQKCCRNLRSQYNCLEPDTVGVGRKQAVCMSLGFEKLPLAYSQICNNYCTPSSGNHLSHTVQTRQFLGAVSE